MFIISRRMRSEVCLDDSENGKPKKNSNQPGVPHVKKLSHKSASNNGLQPLAASMILP